MDRSSERERERKDLPEAGVVDFVVAVVSGVGILDVADGVDVEEDGVLDATGVGGGFFVEDWEAPSSLVVSMLELIFG
jgi:hypothetical protein